MIPMQTGDDLLCSGNGKLSKAIKRMNKLTGKKGVAAEITHQATVILSSSGNPFVAESTTVNKWAGKAGVQVNMFNRCKDNDGWKDNYDGKIWLLSYDFERPVGFNNSAWDFVHDHIDDPYESGIAGGFELLLAGLQLDKAVRLFNEDYHPVSPENLHCSELGVMLKQHLKMASMDAVASRTPPCEFWLDGSIRKYMKYPVKRITRIK